MHATGLLSGLTGAGAWGSGVTGAQARDTQPVLSVVTGARVRNCTQPILSGVTGARARNPTQHRSGLWFGVTGARARNHTQPVSSDVTGARTRNCMQLVLSGVTVARARNHMLNQFGLWSGVTGGGITSCLV